MKHDVTKGSWQRVVVHTPENNVKAESKNTSPLSNKTNKELVLEHLKKHGFKARYTYKYLAEQLGITTNKVFSLRKQLQKENKC